MKARRIRGTSTHVGRQERPATSPEVTVGRSPINGRGLFALVDFPTRRKLGEISGQLVRLPQARQAVAGSKKIYLVEVSRRYALECSEGNSFRFLNHSCRANCYLRIYRRRVEVYTKGGVKAGTELTVDYHATPHQGGMHCTCGVAGCRGRL